MLSTNQCDGPQKLSKQLGWRLMLAMRGDPSKLQGATVINCRTPLAVCAELIEFPPNLPHTATAARATASWFPAGSLT
jgi:hypothetical protein